VVGNPAALALGGCQRLSLTFDLQRPGSDLAFRTLSVQGIDFAFVLSLCIGVYAMHRLAAVVEEGRQQRSEVVQSLLLEVKRPLLSVTTVGGFAELVTFPFGVVGRERRRRRPRSERPGAGDDRDPEVDRDTGDGRERGDGDDRPPEDGAGP
jgi:nitrate reductase NapE component